MHSRGDHYLWRAGLKYFRTSLTVIGPSRRRVKTPYTDIAMNTDIKS